LKFIQKIIFIPQLVVKKYTFYIRETQLEAIAR
jgi:hypothetical protein